MTQKKHHKGEKAGKSAQFRGSNLAISASLLALAFAALKYGKNGAMALALGLFVGHNVYPDWVSDFYAPFFAMTSVLTTFIYYNARLLYDVHVRFTNKSWWQIF